MMTPRVVPALNELERCLPGQGMISEPGARQEFTFKRGKRGNPRAFFAESRRSLHSAYDS